MISGSELEEHVQQHHLPSIDQTCVEEATMKNSRHVGLRKDYNVVVAIVVVYPGKISTTQSRKLLHPPLVDGSDKVYDGVWC